MLFIVDKRQVNVQEQEEDAGQEADHPDADSEAARRVVLVEDAVCLRAPRRVDVALVGDAGEYHHGKQLGWREGANFIHSPHFAEAGRVWRQADKTHPFQRGTAAFNPDAFVHTQPAQ